MKMRKSKKFAVKTVKKNQKRYFFVTVNGNTKQGHATASITFDVYGFFRNQDIKTQVKNLFDIDSAVIIFYKEMTKEEFDAYRLSDI